MESYEIRMFADRLTQIENFLIEVAANEEYLIIRGFSAAEAFSGATEGLNALASVSQDFSALKRAALKMDKNLGQELERLDTSDRLVEQLSLISLKIRMALARRPISQASSMYTQLVKLLPFVSRLGATNRLFGEEPLSLQKTIVNVGRLRGLALACSELMSSKEYLDDEVFKPSNIDADRVLTYIDKALEEVEEITSISPQDRLRIVEHLVEAKREILSSRPSWSKIVGALVIVAAITTGIADAPHAAHNIRDAIEYILGRSVEKPLQKYLPPPFPVPDDDVGAKPQAESNKSGFI